MEYLRKCNLKQFFCLFKNNKKISCDVSVKEFFEYFKNFFENVKIMKVWFVVGYWQIYFIGNIKINFMLILFFFFVIDLYV